MQSKLYEHFGTENSALTAPSLLATIEREGDSGVVTPKSAMRPKYKWNYTKHLENLSVHTVDTARFDLGLSDLADTTTCFNQQIYELIAKQANKGDASFVDGVRLQELASSIYNLIFPFLTHKKAQDVQPDEPVVLPAVWLVVARRIRSLKADAAAAGEVFSLKSEASAKQFLRKLDFTKTPSIFLLENGNLRVLWKDQRGRQIGLQFRDDVDVQYVFFFERKDVEGIRPSYGRDSLTGILQQIENFNLSELLF